MARLADPIGPPPRTPGRHSALARSRGSLDRCVTKIVTLRLPGGDIALSGRLRVALLAWLASGPPWRGLKFGVVPLMPLAWS